MTIRTLFLFLLVIALVSCNESGYETIEFSDFPDTSNLYSKDLNWEECNYPMQMAVFDTILTIVDGANEAFFYFYNINDLSFVGCCGRKGKGPGELSDIPWLLNSYTNDSTDIYFSFVCQSKRTRNTIGIFNSLKANRLIVEKSKQISAILRDQVAIPLNDSLVICRGRNNISVFNENSEEFSYIQKAPKFSISGDPSVTKRLTLEWLKLSPDKKTIVGTFFYLKRFHIYDANGQLKKVIRDSHFSEAAAFEDKMGKRDKYYTFAEFSNDEILIVDLNHKISLMDAQSSNILMFTSEGIPKTKFHLNRSLMDCVAYDQRSQKLFGVDFNSTKLLYFNLNPE